jgi:hypothetical protein
MSKRKFEFHRVFDRNNDLFEFAENDHNSYWFEYDKDDDVLIVTTNSNSSEFPDPVEVTRFYKPTRMIVEYLDELP